MMDIEKLARECGMYFAKDDFGNVPEVECDLPKLEAFASAIRRETLEEAARWCAEQIDDDLSLCKHEIAKAQQEGENVGYERCAEHLRGQAACFMT
jgi:hypothetical protein